MLTGPVLSICVVCGEDRPDDQLGYCLMKNNSHKCLVCSGRTCGMGDCSGNCELASLTVLGNILQFPTIVADGNIPCVCGSRRH